MQAPPGITDDLAQAGLDVHVNVFESRRVLEAAVCDLLGHLIETTVYGSLVFLIDDTCPAQHGRMDATALDILGPHSLVEIDGSIDRFHDRRRPRGEATSPHCVRLQLFW